MNHEVQTVIFDQTAKAIFYLQTASPTRRATTSTTPYPIEVSAADANPETARSDWLPSEAAFECGYRLNVGYIIGGEQAVRGEFPFIALLGYVDQVEDM